MSKAVPPDDRLIRGDRERAEDGVLHRLKAELQQAFAAPDDSYVRFDVERVIDARLRGSIAQER